MKKSAEGDWYFSRDGQQSGPLTFAEIKEKADLGILKPRTDLLWKEGMADWKPIGEIEGLFDRKEQAGLSDKEQKKKEKAQEHAVAASAAAVPSFATEQKMFTGQVGGTRRRSYLFVVYLLPILAIYLFGMAKKSYSGLLSPQIWDQIQQYGPLVLLLLIIFVSIQRFANLGMSRWWYLANFVPILNLWTNYRSFACPEGYALHKKMDPPGVLLAILYWLFVIGAICAGIFFAAVMGGALGSPEIQKQIKDLLAPFESQLKSLPK